MLWRFHDFSFRNGQRGEENDDGSAREPRAGPGRRWHDVWRGSDSSDRGSRGTRGATIGRPIEYVDFEKTSHVSCLFHSLSLTALLCKQTIMLIPHSHQIQSNEKSKGGVRVRLEGGIIYLAACNSAANRLAADSRFILSCSLSPLSPPLPSHLPVVLTVSPCVSSSLLFSFLHCLFAIPIASSSINS